MATYRGKVYRARVRRDGRVRFNGQLSVAVIDCKICSEAVHEWLVVLASREGQKQLGTTLQGPRSGHPGLLAIATSVLARIRPRGEWAAKL
jgi:hypothetical protein